MLNCIKQSLCCARSMPLIMAIIAAAALGIALISQYVFGLEPCILCIIQRYPYGIIIALGIIGFLISFKYNKTVSIIMALIGLTFLANSALAMYHTGVELHWWKSFLEGCAVPEMVGDMDQIIAEIQSRTKAARCDAIAWADPVFGLSMANYNVIFCFGLGIIALLSSCKICKSSKTQK